MAEAHQLGYAFLPQDPLKAPSGEELLEYVRQKKVEKATNALVEGTDPNFQDRKTGDTALHVAVSIKSEVLVKLLIVFDANLTLKNSEQQTALDLARKEGATAIADDIERILKLQNDLDADQPKERAASSCQATDDQVEKVTMLSLDGSGIRGLVFIQVFLEMDKRRKRLYPQSPTLLSCFNWVTGNSTGGIAALAFAAANKDPLQGRRLYFQLKDEVLGGTELPYPNEKVDKVFKDVYGPLTTMSEIKNRKVSVMTTLATQSPPILHIMSNYGSARNKQDPPQEQLVWKAARATSSVPVYFHPQDDKYIDGGFIANNPTSDTIIDMFEYYAKNEDKKVKLQTVLSLGCGLSPATSIDDIGFHPSHFGNLVSRILDLISHSLGEKAQELFLVLHNHNAFFQLLKMLASQITQPNGEVLKRSEFISDKVGAKFFRINPQIDNVNFLTTDDKTLIDMLYQVVYYMLKHCRDITDPVLECIYGQ